MLILGHFSTNSARFVAYSVLGQICKTDSVSFSVFTESLCQGVFREVEIDGVDNASFYNLVCALVHIVQQLCCC